MTTATPRRPLSSLFELPSIPDVGPPRWFERLPTRLGAAGLVLVLVLGLVAVSAYLRTRTLGGELWFNEATATGIASHSLSELPGVLRRGGSAPLYYLLLHFWIDAFGSSESATHALSLLFGLLSIPLGMWAGQSLFGRRAGVFAAVLFAFSSFLTQYASETQPYELMVLLGLLAVAGFVHAFIYRRRRYLWLFALALTLMLYTQGTVILFWFGAAVALVPVCLASDDRRGILRDAAITFGAAAILYLPWLPTTIYQVSHATAPWHYAPLLGASVPGDLLGAQRIDVTLLMATVIAVVPLLTRGRRWTPDATAMWVLIAIPLAGLALARVGTLVTPTWVTRYFAPLVAPLLLLSAYASARARVLGVVAIVLCVGFLANPSSFAPSYKSDMQDVAAELGPRLHQNDLVVVGQPEQTPLAWYYLPGRLRYANTAGEVSDPRYMNWAGALARVQDANPRATLGALVASLRPGQQLLYVRPLTEGAQNWDAPWTQLIRRRSAQWGAILTSDVAAGTLKPVAGAPQNYRGACCVADSAMLYQKAFQEPRR
jgi:mannosyltransferase